MRNIIKFKAHEFIIKDKSIHPTPGKFNIPEWYKNIKVGDYQNLNIKNCKPFLDSLVTGYIIKNPIDQEINFNTPDPRIDNKLNTWININGHVQDHTVVREVNVNRGNEIHKLSQVGGSTCPFAVTNKMVPIYKIINPWIVEVPKDYSVLYLPPLNRPDDRFEILAGIVDGDHQVQVNFPCVFKKEGTWLLEKGTPIATAFPFKNENWKMDISEITEREHSRRFFTMGSKLTKYYEKLFWKKKSWN